MDHNGGFRVLSGDAATTPVPILGRKIVPILLLMVLDNLQRLILLLLLKLKNMTQLLLKSATPTRSQFQDLNYIFNI